MLREHIPLIAVTAVIAILMYLIFRDLRSLRAGLDSLTTQVFAGDTLQLPSLTASPTSAPPESVPPSSEPAKGAKPDPTSSKPVAKRA